MIRPTYFGFNPETAGSNAFQKDTGLDPAEVRAKAIEEWEGLVAALEAHEIEVIQFDDTPEPHTPDACFPNNWISCHADGTIVLYPMMAPNRRLEYRQDIVDHLRTLEPYKDGRILDLRHHAEEGRFLEGTGSLVLDRKTRTAYAALSARTHLSVAEEWAREMDYELITFHAQDARGAEIYHTNVMMSVGDGTALVCLDSVTSDAEHDGLEAALSGAGLKVHSIGFKQLDAFVGNCLALVGASGDVSWVLSKDASSALRESMDVGGPEEMNFAPIDLHRIEGVGGGGVRCCLCEVSC
jgi:hypothetical protein